MSEPDPPSAPVTLAGIRALLPLLGRHKGALAVAGVLSLVAAAAALLQPYLVGRVITEVQSGRPVATLAGVLVGVLLAGSLVTAVSQYLLGRTAEGLVLTTRSTLVARLLRLPIAEYDRRRTGDLLSRVTTDTTLLRAVVTGGLVDAVASVLTVVGAIVAMALVDGVLLGVTLVAVTVGVVGGLTVASRVRGLSLTSQQEVGEMSAAVDRTLSAVRTVRVAGATDREEETILQRARAAYRAGVRAAAVEAAAFPLLGLAVQGAFIAVLGTGGYRVARGDLTVADLVAFILYLFLLVLPLGGLLNAFTQLQLGLGALTRIQEVLALPPEDDGPVAAPGPESLADRADGAAAPRVELDRVSFGYPGGLPVLHAVSFAVPRGSTTALVGPSGAGKSTVLALVARLYDPTSGSLLLDGRDVRGMSRAAVRAQLGYVEQETPVLAGSLRDNVTLGQPEAGDAAVRAVLTAVRLTDLADRTDAGLDAQVGEGGVLLSGGERQRLAIARALLPAPDLILLDEPTASLDARNEAALRATLDAARATGAVLVVAHRLSTVVDADQIVVLDAGRVVGRGRHAELVDTVPLYRELATTQLLAPEAADTPT